MPLRALIPSVVSLALVPCAMGQEADVALDKVEEVPEGISPARLGDSDAVRVGERVSLIGAP